MEVFFGKSSVNGPFSSTPCWTNDYRRVIEILAVAHMYLSKVDPVDQPTKFWVQFIAGFGLGRGTRKKTESFETMEDFPRPITHTFFFRVSWSQFSSSTQDSIGLTQPRVQFPTRMHMIMIYQPEKWWYIWLRLPIPSHPPFILCKANTLMLFHPLHPTW